MRLIVLATRITEDFNRLPLEKIFSEATIFALDQTEGKARGLSLGWVRRCPPFHHGGAWM
jgi:hypothetical protein